MSTKTQLSLAPDLLCDDPDVALALVLLLLLDLLHRQVLPLLPVYGASLALEDLRALKPKGVVLLNKSRVQKNKVLLGLPVHGAAFAPEDLRTLKPEGVVLQNKGQSMGNKEKRKSNSMSGDP
jgi:hypothetical protein